MTLTDSINAMTTTPLTARAGALRAVPRNVTAIVAAREAAAEATRIAALGGFSRTEDRLTLPAETRLACARRVLGDSRGPHSLGYRGGAR